MTTCLVKSLFCFYGLSNTSLGTEVLRTFMCWACRQLACYNSSNEFFEFVSVCPYNQTPCLADGALGAAATAAQEKLHCLVDSQHDENNHHALQ
jgi:hypothetical protein